MTYLKAAIIWILSTQLCFAQVIQGRIGFQSVYESFAKEYGKLRQQPRRLAGDVARGLDRKDAAFITEKIAVLKENQLPEVVVTPGGFRLVLSEKTIKVGIAELDPNMIKLDIDGKLVQLPRNLSLDTIYDRLENFLSKELMSKSLLDVVINDAHAGLGAALVAAIVLLFFVALTAPTFDFHIALDNCEKERGRLGKQLIAAAATGRKSVSQDEAMTHFKNFQDLFMKWTAATDRCSAQQIMKSDCENAKKEFNSCVVQLARIGAQMESLSSIKIFTKGHKEIVPDSSGALDPRKFDYTLSASPGR